MTLFVHPVPPKHLDHFLLGGIVGGVVVRNGPGIYGLEGRTLIFTAPVGVVTFAPAVGEAMTPLAIKAQIEADIPALLVTFIEGSLAINLAAPALGIALSPAGTANPYLGFDTLAATEGTYYNPPGGGVPELVSIKQISGGFIQVITDE